MPDRYGETPTDLDSPDEIWAAQARAKALAIVNCDQCDDDGYTAARRVCDHVRRDTTHGRALVRQELAKIRQRKAERARGLTE